MFSDRLRQTRQELGLTLEELADKYNMKYNKSKKGMNKSTLSNYENGVHEPQGDDKNESL